MHATMTCVLVCGATKAMTEVRNSFWPKSTPSLKYSSK